MAFTIRMVDVATNVLDCVGGWYSMARWARSGAPFGVNCDDDDDDDDDGGL